MIRPRRILPFQSRNPMGCIALLAGVSLFLQTGALALDWTSTELEQHAAVGASLEPYVFTFANSGAAPVTITGVRLSCVCLSSDLSREKIPPGESGTLTVHFDRTGLTGEVDRTIAVTTDEKDRDAPYTLVLRATLPEALTIAPRLVHWKAGSPEEKKSVDIKVNMPAGAEITGAAGNRDDFTLALVTLEPRRRYRLDITPRGTGTPRLAIIMLRVTETLPTGSALTVYAQVR